MAETKVTKNEIEAQENWIAPTLSGSWVNYGSGFATAGYMKDSMGFVHMKGLIKSGTSTAFTLPAGYRPVETQNFATMANNLFGFAEVRADGAVTPVGSNAYFSLDTIHFKAEN